MEKKENAEKSSSKLPEKTKENKESIIVDYLIVVPRAYEKGVQAEIGKIQKSSRVDSLRIEPISGLQLTTAVRAISSSSHRKRQIVKEFTKLFEDLEYERSRHTAKEPFCILVPESMVSIVIGKNGNQIKQLQLSTKTEIFINSTKYENGKLRCAQIKGKDRDIAEACKKIYGLIEDRAPFAWSVSKGIFMGSPERNIVYTTQRIVLHTECLDELRKTGTFSKIEELFRLNCTYADEPHNPALKPYDSCTATLSGHSKDVRKALLFLFERMDEFALKNHTQDVIKILIQQHYASKNHWGGR